MANKINIFFLMLLIFIVNFQELHAQDSQNYIQEKREFFKIKKSIYNNPQAIDTYPREKIKASTGVTQYSFPLSNDINYTFEDGLPSNTIFNESKVKKEKTILLPILGKLEEDQLKQIIKEVFESNEIKIDSENLFSDSLFDMNTAYPLKTPKIQNTEYFNSITIHFKHDITSHNLYLRFDLFIIKKVGNEVSLISKSNNCDIEIKKYFISQTEALMGQIEKKLSKLKII